jgi:bifunctional DNase/RNase
MIASMASACRRRITAVVIDSREGDLLRAKVVVEGQKSKFLLEAGAAEAIVLAMTASAPIYAVRSLLMAGEQESEGEMFPPRRSS